MCHEAGVWRARPRAPYHGRRRVAIVKGIVLGVWLLAFVLVWTMGPLSSFSEVLCFAVLCALSLIISRYWNGEVSVPRLSASLLS